jgi:hypothetical protein
MLPARCESAVATARPGLERIAAPLLAALMLGCGSVLVAHGARGLL